MTIRPLDAGDAPVGVLARAVGMHFPVMVCESAAGHYLGTRDAEGLPFSRESQEYWPTADLAAAALASGRWTQRHQP